MTTEIVGQWSKEKLDLLSKYLHAYTTILVGQKRKFKNWPRKIHYVDGFAGAGQAIVGKSRDAKAYKTYIEGSPVCALQCEPPFDEYWFIELSPEKAQRLERLRLQFPQKKINVICGDCNDIITNQIALCIQRSRKELGFAFLDPYGLQINWETIIALANSKAFDVFINFSLLGFMRMLPKSYPPRDANRERLARIMGNLEWIKEVYQLSHQPTLFGGDRPIVRPTLRAERLALIYRDQLKQLFPYVSDPFVMRTPWNSPIYALILASHKEVAVNIMNDIFDRHERLSRRHV